MGLVGALARIGVVALSACAAADASAGPQPPGPLATDGREAAPATVDPSERPARTAGDDARAEPAAPTQHRGGARAADAERSCPPDPGREAQRDLAAPVGLWPAEVRLRIHVRADGRIDCVDLVSSTQPTLPELEARCREMLGAQRPPALDAAGKPVPGWLTFLCQLEPAR